MSEIRANTISDAAGTGPVTLTGQYAAKAWVNFDGTGTVSVTESGNISSLTDNGTGDYTITFTQSMTDGNYSTSGSVGNLLYSLPADSSVRVAMPYQPPFVSGSHRIMTRYVNATSSNMEDEDVVSYMIFR